MLLPSSLLKVVTLWMRSHVTNEVLKVAVGALVGRLIVECIAGFKITRRSFQSIAPNKTIVVVLLWSVALL
jgi:hypothetical protein